MKKFVRVAARKMRNFWFAAGMRLVVRDASQNFVPRTIIKTPKVRGRRLALKPMPSNPELERTARRAIIECHKNITPISYGIKLSKRFLPLRNKRTEIYYDRPSLEELIEKRENRRVRDFLRNNNITLEQAHGKALFVWKELGKNVVPIRLLLDFKESQFMVNKLDKEGRFELIVIDL